MRIASHRTCCPPSQDRQSGKVLGKLLLVVAGFILIFETAPRIVDIPGLERETLVPGYVASEDGKKFEPHPYLIFTPKPGEYEKGGAGSMTHGPGGFRGAEPPVEKPEGGLRIACVGGSSTYGTGPSQDAFTWPARLQTVLSGERPGQHVDVLNCGAPSWNSFECLSNLAFRVVPYAPDIVLIYLGTNDAECAMWPGATSDNSHYRIAWPVYRPSPIEPILEKSILYLTWRKYGTDYLSQRADLGFESKALPEGAVGQAFLQRKVPGDLGPLPETGFINFQRNLTSMVAVATAHGAMPVLMTQAIYSTDPGGDHLNQGAVRLAAQNRMTEIVRSMASERGIPLVDMKPVLENAAAQQIAAGAEQTIFTDNVHLTDEGTALMATTLASELKRIGVL